jgi:hypothetical protein
MAKRKQPQELVSKHISEFLDYLVEANSLYAQSHAEMLEQDSLTQDYLHKLELETLSSSERSKIALQLGLCRQDRRNAKDKFEELTPLVEWSGDPDVVKVIRKLQETLGQTRKVERNHQNRIYIPKVLKDN